MEEETLRMERYQWSTLNHLQVGRYAEYLVKMEFVLFGSDVYGGEVDDKGIDFVVRTQSQRYYDIQVKSARKLNYIFFRKETFQPRSNLLAAVVLFEDHELPRPYLIPSLRWTNPDVLFVDRNYQGKKSKPEWGLSLTRSRLRSLADYAFDRVVPSLDAD